MVGLSGKGGELGAGSIPGMCLAPAPVLVAWGARCWAAPPGKCGKESLSLGGRSWFGQLFLEGRYWEHLEPCRAVPAESASQMYGVWLLFQGSEKCEVFRSRKTQSCPSTRTAIWFDITCYVYNQKCQRKDTEGMGKYKDVVYVHMSIFHCLLVLFKISFLSHLPPYHYRQVGWF